MPQHLCRELYWRLAEAINAVFPQTTVQTCIVHPIRHSMNCASWKDRKHVAKALKLVYRAADAEAGQAARDDFADGPWGEKYSAITLSWRRNWDLVIPFFAFPEGVRRIMYTTNAIESLNAKLRMAVLVGAAASRNGAAAPISFEGWPGPVADPRRSLRHGRQRG